MSESTVQIPIQVTDKGAIAELRKIQKALGDVGKESATVNKAIAAGMEANAKKVGAAYTDIAEKVKKASNVWGEFNSKLQVFNKVVDWGKQAVDLAKFSDEFRRLERAVPVERMRALEKEADGTVTKFELLKKAAKDMGLSATAGMDDANRAFRSAMASWQDTVTSLKVWFGELIRDTIVWVDDLSDRIAGTRKLSRSERIRQDTSTSTWDLLAGQGHGAQLSSIVGRLQGGMPGNLSHDDVLLLNRFLTTQAQGIAAYAPRYARDRAAEDAEAAVAGGRAMNPWGRGSGYADQVEAAKRKRDGGAGGYRFDGWLSSFDSANPRAYQNMPWGNYLGNAAREGYQDMGGGDLADTSGSWLVGGGLSKGIGNVLGGFGAAGSAAGGLGQDIAGAMPSQEAIKRIEEQIAAAERLQATMTEITGPVIQGFATGLGAAFDAIITGSDNAGKAFAKASAQALKSLAVESAVRAVYHGAMALGSLAFQDYKGAGMHGASAAKFAATALLAGAGAAGLASASGGWDTGGAGGGGGASASSYAPVSGGQRDTGPTHVTVNVYGNLLPGSEARLGAEIEKATETARRSGRITDTANVTRFS
jgi:hypothetical protein